MNNLISSEEEQLLQKRRLNFEKFLAERMSVLADFAKTLGLDNPNFIVASPENYLNEIGDFMRNQTVAKEDRIWIKVRLGYFIGEIFVNKFYGCWFINEVPNSKYFARYVVGKFAYVQNKNIMFDPFEVAESFLVLPKGRSLSSKINEVEQEILQTKALN